MKTKARVTNLQYEIKIKFNSIIILKKKNIYIYIYILSLGPKDCLELKLNKNIKFPPHRKQVHN